MAYDFDILVIGGGMVGACAAALLAREPALTHARIALLEAQPPASPPDGDTDIRVSALSRASQRILTRAQAWSHIQSQHRSAYSQMTVWDAASKVDGIGALHFSAARTGEANLGYIVENRRVQWALFESEAMRRVTVLRAQLLKLDFDADCVRATLADRRQLRVRLALGADGASSVSRSLAGIETGGWKYDQFAVVTHVNTERPHNATAWQRFTARGPVAFLPLADGRSSVVWTTTPDQSEQLLAAEPQEFERQLQDASDHALGAVTLAAPRARFPLQLAHAKQYTRPRFALLGDAAHAVHPLAGQGVNLGLMDCAALVETLVQHHSSSLPTSLTTNLDLLGEPKALRRYERWRKSENLLAMGLIDGINRLFSNQSEALGAVRRFGFAAIERTPAAKRWLIMRALGLAGERPESLSSWV
jgi:2-polyprenylphenol 6-hydroxylase